MLREYFELLRKHRIQLNIRKSTFFPQKVKFLGLERDGNEMRILEKRVCAIGDAKITRAPLVAVRRSFLSQTLAGGHMLVYA